MKIALAIVLAVVAAASIIAVPIATEQFASAGSIKKVHFTDTVVSTQDPGIGHGDGYLAMILLPNENTIYDGSMTYTASSPVQPVILHEISAQEVLGQPIWSVDNSTVYGLSLLEQGGAGSIEFTGAALALRGADEFVATVSIDGWIRGQPIEVVQKFVAQSEEAELRLARSNVSVTIPMREGLYNGSSLYYIITDSSNENYAERLSAVQNWNVLHAPLLGDAPSRVLEKVYVFENGVDGDGLLGNQPEVFTSTPEQADEYSALREMVYVSWQGNITPVLLDTEEKILEAKSTGRVQFDTKAILNAPQMAWPEGQMPVAGDGNETDAAAQVTTLDIEAKKVTFTAHRGWGHDGRATYCIAVDAAPAGPAEQMGVVAAPRHAALTASPAAADLFQFSNGIKGPGLLGFQPGIFNATTDDGSYTPMWRVHQVAWNDSADAVILETVADIEEIESQDLITVSLARPRNADYVINCPMIDPS